MSPLRRFTHGPPCSPYCFVRQGAMVEEKSIHCSRGFRGKHNTKKISCWLVGCFEDLRRFSDISAI